MSPETIMNWSKFIVYCKIDDPYVWSTLVGKVKERIKRFHCDQLLVVLVNIAHSLSSEASNLFNTCAAHFAQKMDRAYNPPNDETLITEEDVVKV